MKRVIHRFVMQPLAAMVSDGQIEADAEVVLEVDAGRERLILRPTQRAA